MGGSDAARHHTDVFRLEWREGKLVTSRLPPLPKPVANACGALVGNTLYIAGGTEKPDAKDTLTTVYRLDLAVATPAWREMAGPPGGGRMLAAAAGFDGAFWLVGGVDLVAGRGGQVERRYRKDAFRYTLGKGWERLADLPRPIAAAPSPAPDDGTGFLLLGGDDGAQVEVAPARHRGFRTTTLRYDVRKKAWAEAGELPAARVTVPCVRWGRSWVIPSGEGRPGVRFPDVWRWTPGNEE